MIDIEVRVPGRGLTALRCYRRVFVGVFGVGLAVALLSGPERIVTTITVVTITTVLTVIAAWPAVFVTTHGVRVRRVRGSRLLDWDRIVEIDLTPHQRGYRVDVVSHDRFGNHVVTGDLIDDQRVSEFMSVLRQASVEVGWNHPGDDEPLALRKKADDIARHYDLIPSETPRPRRTARDTRQLVVVVVASTVAIALSLIVPPWLQRTLDDTPNTPTDAAEARRTATTAFGAVADPTLTTDCTGIMTVPPFISDADLLVIESEERLALVEPSAKQRSLGLSSPWRLSDVRVADVSVIGSLPDDEDVTDIRVKASDARIWIRCS